MAREKQDRLVPEWPHGIVHPDRQPRPGRLAARPDQLRRPPRRGLRRDGRRAELAGPGRPDRGRDSGAVRAGAGCGAGPEPHDRDRRVQRPAGRRLPDQPHRLGELHRRPGRHQGIELNRALGTARGAARSHRPDLRDPRGAGHGDRRCGRRGRRALAAADRRHRLRPGRRAEAARGDRRAVRRARRADRRQPDPDHQRRPARA